MPTFAFLLVSLLLHPCGPTKEAQVGLQVVRGWAVVGCSNLHTYLCFSSCIYTSAPLRSNKKISSRPPGSERLGCGWIVQHLHAYLCFFSCISTSTSLRSNKRSSSRLQVVGDYAVVGWSNLHTYLCFSCCISSFTSLRSNNRSSSRPPGSGRLGCGWVVQHLHTYLCFSSCIFTSTSLWSNKQKKLK
jgi:hypothetical protein